MQAKHQFHLKTNQYRVIMIFFLLNKVESYLQKDLEKYHKIAKDFDKVDKNTASAIKGKKL